MDENAKLRDYLARVSGELQNARLQLRDQDEKNAEPIAIVGMACRFPDGVDSPDDLWRLVAEGRDAIAPFPENRGWDVEGLYDPDPDAAGKTYSLTGGFLYDADEFDAGLFGINPREAQSMDPQQRLLLESAWETFERAGIAPESIRGSRTGVFAGVIQHDYGSWSGAALEAMDGYQGTGTAGGVASGRISYVFGLEGPAVTIDTACSSSLVAMHLACQSLRAGECSMALAGGASVMATPGMFVDFSRQRGLARDGRCKSFADSADGTNFSEGVGLVLLERLSDAERNGHEVLAVIRGSAVNQDGASNGLTAPNGPSQQRVIRQALANARLSAADVDVVEAHGTGTTLGDPIEAQALLATYGQDRPADRPLWLGSVKSNIGHTQAAAGVAGVIKMVQAMRHGIVPRTLHVDTPSTHVDWSAGAVSLLTEERAWPVVDRPRRAAVSSFGVSGTNAHVVVEQAPVAPEPQVTAGDPGVVLWVVSGATAAGLRAQAGRLERYVRERPELGPGEVGLALAIGRARLDHRAVVVGTDRDALLSGLAAVGQGAPATGVVSAEGSPLVADGGRVVFVFPGQGSQWEGMALELMESSEVFRDRLLECEEALLPLVGWSVRDALCGGEDAPDLSELDVVQPVLFSVMVSLAALWRSMGVEPEVVVGHSQGEIVAACVAGALSLQDAARIVALRSRLLLRLVGRGALVSLALPHAEAEKRIARWGGRLTVAAVNGPSAVVIAGDTEALDELLALCGTESVRAREIASSVPSHSAHVEFLEDEVRDVLASVVPRSGGVPFFSTVTGELVDGGELDAGYWYRNLREPVRFEPVVRSLMERGFDTFVEVSPHPVIIASVEDIAAATGSGAVAGGTLRRGEGGLDRFLLSAGHLSVCGVRVDWGSVFAGRGLRPVALPTYAFQRERFWMTGTETAGDVGTYGLTATGGHCLLGAVVELPDSGGVVVSGRLSVRDQPWLAGHRVLGEVVVPGAALVEMAIRAGDEAGCPDLDELVIQVPLVLTATGAAVVRIVVDEADGSGRRAVTVHARAEEGTAAWVRHATGSLASAGEAPRPAAGEPAAWPPAGAEPVPVGEVYEEFAARGLEYGPVFRGLESVWRRGDETFSEVGLAEEGRAEIDGFGMHPALLDAVLHAVVLSGAVPGIESGVPWMPFVWSGVRLHAVGASRVRVRITAAEPGAMRLDVTDEAGGPVLTVDSLTLRPLPEGGLAPPVRTDDLFRLDWAPLDAEPVAVSPDENWTVVGEDPHGLGLPPCRSLTTSAEAAGSVEEAPPTVVVWSAPHEARAGSVPDADSIRSVTCQALDTLQRWLADETCADSRLVVVTSGGADVAPGEPVDAGAAAVWGLVRSAQAENPGRITLLDLAPGSEPTVPLLAGALATGEPQLALRADGLRAPRLMRMATGGAGVPLPLAPQRLAAPEPVLASPEPADGHSDTFDAVRIGMRAAGSAENMEWLPADDVRRELAPGQIRVAVRAAGLNFRDVVAGLGMIGGDVGLLGTEAAGAVLDVGAEVTDLAPGDRVAGLALGSFATVVVSDRRGWVRIPDTWSFAQAATVPVVFLTAYYGLNRLARLRAGETLLVHAASGGVGMAAIQLARHIGAEVFATASPPKWPTVEGLGISPDRIANSRTLDFEETFRAATGGRGVDMVLNSLAAEYVDASLRLLAPGGRFLEMGKTDIRDPEQVAAVRTDIAYQAYDGLDAGLDRVAEMLAEVMELFERGVLSPLPTTLFDVRQAPEAFRLMAQARHTGKIVLTVDRAPDPAGSVVVTGGTGDLGGLVARHLVSRYGVRRVVLASRSGEQAEGAAELRAGLEALGAEVDVVACDVTNRQAVAELLAEIPAERPLTGVVHCAATLDDGVIPALDPERIRRAFAPKVDAVHHFDELTRGADLSLFAVFSSAAGVLGSPGQGNYAAANAAVDALMAGRRAAGLPGASLAWGWWGQGKGQTSGLGQADRERFARGGVAPMSPDEGLALFDAALAHNLPLTVPVKLDLARLARSGPLPPLLSALAPASAAGRRTALGGAERDGDDGAQGLRRRLAALSAAEQDRHLVDLVARQVSTVLGHAPSVVLDVSKEFTALGFDSLTAVELRNRLSRSTGLRLPATLTFDHPTPLALAHHLQNELVDGLAELTAPPESAEPTGPVGHRPGSAHPAGVVALPAGGRALPAAPAASDGPIAIVGMGCRFPGGAADPELFWQNLLDGVDAASEVPPDRWDMDAYYHPRKGVPGKAYTRKASFVPDLADWDAEFFGCTPQEAYRLDPQHRLLLEMVWTAMEDAGIPAERLRGSRTGVFLGLSDSSQYSRRQVETEGLACFDDPSFFLGLSSSAAAGRIAYHLDLRGPSMTVDTACSSALTATHLAVQSLRRGECDLAIIAAASALIDPSALVQACKMSMLAADGRCKTFDEAADGFVAGEGSAAIVLQRAEDAEAEHRPAHAVIRGSAMTQDGRSNGLTAPSRPAQAAVVRAALSDAGLQPDDIGFVEAHGSGTSLGDAIEFGALQEVFGDRRVDHPLLIGAVKTHVGHLLTTAGMAGLIKSVLALRSGELPANLHLERPNADVSLDGPVRPAQSRQPFPAAPGAPRRAGVSSFGWSGTNIHLVVEEAPPAPQHEEPADEPAATEPRRLVTLSATNAASLREAAAALAAHLEREPGLDLADVAFTTQTGRTAFPVRRALLCRDLPDAIERLRDPAGADGTVSPARKHRIGLLLPADEAPSGATGGLYGTEPAFRAAVDACAELAAERFGTDLGGLRDTHPGPVGDGGTADAAVLSAFTVQYALVALLEAYGVRPAVLLGHGVGAYVAACAAGVFALPDAMSLALDPGRAASVTLYEPRAGLFSAATGRPLTPEECADPAYWAALPGRPVADADSAQGLARYATVLVEAGWGGTLDATASPEGAPVTDAAEAPVPPVTVRLLPAPGGAVDRGTWLAGIGRLWELGVTVDWGAGRTVRRELLRLPGYRFQRARYWPMPAARPAATAGSVTANGDAPAADARGTRFLASAWRRQDALPTAPGPTEPATVLVLADRAGLGRQVAEQAEAAGDEVVFAEAGDGYLRTGGGVTIDPRSPEDYERLLTELNPPPAPGPKNANGSNTTDGTHTTNGTNGSHSSAAAAGPLRIVHAFGHHPDPAAGLEHALDHGFYSVLWLVQAIGRVLPGRDVELVVALSGTFDVLGGERVRPLSAPVVGLARSIGVEYPRIRTRCVDLDPEAGPDRAAGQLLREFGLLTTPATAPAATGSDSSPSAWRRGRRWLPGLEEVGLPAVSDDQVWRPDGVYAITGGLGGLGMALARRLAPMGARLALIGRTELPEPDLWDWWISSHRADDRISAVLLAIRQLRAAGAEVLPVPADISRPDEAAEAFRTVRAHFGEVYGVIHTAGVPGEGLLQYKTKEQAAAVLAPKIAGTLAVADALREAPPELLVLYSSTVTAVGGHGEGDYGAANAFLDAFAAAEDGAGAVAGRVVSVGWGAWQHDRWQTKAYAAAPALRDRARRIREEYGFTDEEGTAALGRIIAAGPSHLYALNQPLDDLVDAMRMLSDPDALAGTGTGPGTGAGATAPERRYPRPDLRVSYIAPRDDTERRVADTWGELLGMERVGVHDPFFELGGTSLVGLALVNRLAAEFGVELAAASLFEHPTVAQLAELLDSLGAGGSGTAGSGTAGSGAGGAGGDADVPATPAPGREDGSAARGQRRRAQAGASTIKRRRTGK
ncbi:SDR family NAD(P)-dependent oxidoreductase [Streptomyces sp. NPDC096310]|uniref:SDR family NAD(P)-dependent oxidoreductase n=1 Tax=Streptomyces sp. NPDC096310 TaxID=3366082 RepID=UPI00381E3254